MAGHDAAKGLNTVSLFGDLDEMELMHEVEAAFGITFDATEPALRTIADYSRPKGREINRETRFFATEARKGSQNG